LKCGNQTAGERLESARSRRQARARHADRLHRRLRDPPRRLDPRAGAHQPQHGQAPDPREPGGSNTARTTRIAEALVASGFEAVVSEFIEKEFWVKLLGNVSFQSGVGADHDDGRTG